MEQRSYRGPLKPDEIARVLVARFNQGSLAAQQLAGGERSIVQIGTRDRRRGIENALAVTITRTGDGVDVAVTPQEWLDAASDLAQAGLGALFNPLSLLSNLGEIVSDVNSFSLPGQVWETVSAYVKSVGANLGQSLKETTVKCEYCSVTSPAGTAKCPACGATLGGVQPVYCPRCGQLAARDARYCPRCGSPLG